MPHSDQSAHPSPDGSGENLHLCAHCEMLGASSVIRPDPDAADIIHCTLCQLTFHFVTEGPRIIVTRIDPYQGEI